MAERWLFIILLAFFAALIFLNPVVGWQFKQFLLFGGTFAPQPSDTPALENASLRAQLSQLENIQNQFPQWSPTYLKAYVYARYPFNFKNEFLVNAGRKQGVMTGQAAAIPAVPSPRRVQDTVFVGKVGNVFENTALVETVFDGRFQLAVRIGRTASEALLTGGNEPKIVLIPKTAAVAGGDVVYVAAAGFPYGMAIGEIGEVTVSRDNLFQEATLSLPYDASTVRAVLILIYDTGNAQ